MFTDLLRPRSTVAYRPSAMTKHIRLSPRALCHLYPSGSLREATLEHSSLRDLRMGTCWELIAGPWPYLRDPGQRWRANRRGSG